ncbi:hypothetical protein U1P98_07480 [Lysinibacillus irui]|uniref:Prophage tail endopeptidase domain-containing protein n=1 Tax=Lysinibacillus irui TaxID=2998077 RepID=A0ABU5NJD6_9BACI|nr:hypothetical protein [Lysinibacillus irui]MEA0553756.1 hypothetical protein [Lysinibacillus irui]MEA0976140.1 hypothetical protein [Lysinibacillus irui]MEA1042294.1 hypothetical protein [Lysinibacillus irui]
MRVLVNNQVYEVIYDSVEISTALSERSTASFTVRSLNSSLTFEKGMPVEIYYGDEYLFGGVIDGYVKVPVTVVGGYFFHINCVDYHYFADKRIVARAFKNMTCGEIVRAIHADYLAPEGITIGEIHEGDKVEDAVFNYMDVASVMTKLANYMSNFTWYIDKYKKLHYIQAGTSTAPFLITHAVARVNGSNFEESSPYYRNRQYLVGAVDVTDTQEEVHYGDGSRRIFTLRYKVHEKPKVEVKYSGSEVWEVKTVGIDGLDMNKDFYWNKGSYEIRQEEQSSEEIDGVEVTTEIPALEAFDMVRISYRGQFETIIMTQLHNEITRMKSVDNTTGIVESIEKTSAITDRTSSMKYANALLDKYGQISRMITFETDNSGLVVGQVATVNMPIYSIHKEDFLIDSVQITWSGGQPVYKVTAVKGPSHGTWESMFSRISGLGENQVERENLKESSQIVLPFEFSKVWREDEEPNIFKRDAHLATYTGFYAGLLYKDRVKYMSWFRNGVEIGRVPAAQYTEGKVDTLFTLFYLQPNQGNGDITELVWWGGSSATDELGTGFIIDRQPFVRKKINTEAYQIVRYDYKWT